MRNTKGIRLLLPVLLVLTFGVLRAQYIQTPQPYWYVVGAGALAARPATCTANWHTWICNGAGCTTNGEYHYCTALNTWTVASGADDFVRAASALTTVSAMPRVSAAGTIGESKLSCTGSPVTCTAYDNTAVTGSTTVTVRPGAGQGETNLFSVLDLAGTDRVRTRIPAAAGNVLALEYYTGAAIKLSVFGSAVQLASDSILSWNSAASVYNATSVGLSRPAAGLLQLNSGAAGNFRDLQLRKMQWNNDAEPACDATTRGYVVMVQGGVGVADTFRICSKDALDAYAWRALY